MGNLCRVPSERPVLGKELVAERESAPRDLRVARGFRRRPRVAFPRAGAERRPMLSSRRRFARWAALRGKRSPGERSPVCFVTLCACALGEAAGAEVQQHCFDPVRASAALGTRASAKLQLKSGRRASASRETCRAVKTA